MDHRESVWIAVVEIGPGREAAIRRHDRIPEAISTCVPGLEILMFIEDGSGLVACRTLCQTCLKPINRVGDRATEHHGQYGCQGDDGDGNEEEDMRAVLRPVTKHIERGDALAVRVFLGKLFRLRCRHREQVFWSFLVAGGLEQWRK